MRVLASALALILLAPVAAALVALPVDPSPVKVRFYAPAFVEVGTSARYYGFLNANAAETVRAGLPNQPIRVNGPDVDTRTDLDGRFEIHVPYAARGEHWVSASWRAGGFNTFGEAAQRVVVADRPSAPLSLVVAPGPHWDEAVLAWAEPVDDGGAPITAYHAAASPGADVVVMGARSAIVASLVTGVPTQISVRAANGVGQGAAATATFVPEAPAPVDALEIAITGFLVCEIACWTVRPGETYWHDGPVLSPDVRAVAEHRLVRDDVGVAHTILRSRIESHVVGGYGPAITTLRGLTDADGLLVHTGGQSGTERIPEGQCRAVVAEAASTYGALTSATSASALLCMPVR